ncbi:MAG: fumarylacetoacetate hydrolase family protein [bacterium]|nr:fumarylacetoacetate hydrolase family protein [bacterium]
MKIICIGRNYVAHAKELGNEVPTEPVIFLKPDTALLKNNDPFYYPGFSKDIHHEVELVLRISREGKNIEPQFAHKYFDQVGLGIDFTARDLQTKAKSKGLPWDLAKGFNGSAPVSKFIKAEEIENRENINFKLLVNGEERQNGNTQNMLFKFGDIISYISKFILLKTGDLIFTGTPEGVSAVNIGDRLEGYIEDQKMLDFEVK